MASTTRQALLQALSAAEGAYISGQQLAQQLGVSRAAVHKAAAALTAQGYALEAASRRGYRLLGGDPFCTEAVGPYPAPVQLYDTLESTNRTAKLLALEGAAHGTLVLAGGQTAGRGRLGRSFASPAGKGVYCSVVLRPPLPAANAQTATIGAIATTTAYNEGDLWFQDAFAYVCRNLALFDEQMRERFAGVGYIKPQGTYIAWLDFSPLGIDDPAAYFLEKAQVALTDGRSCGETGAGCVRVNIAMPYPLLVECLDRMYGALHADGLL